MLTQKAFDSFNKVREKSEVMKSEPDSLFVHSHLLLGWKGIEVSADNDQMKWKARLVAGGDVLHDSYGHKVIEADLYGAPASLEEVRIVIWRATMSPDCALLQADVLSAYLQAFLKGKTTYIELPKKLWPAQWFDEDGNPKYRHPVLRLHKAIYGLRRSGFDWMKHADNVLQHHGWQPIHDYADSMYMKPTPKGPLLLCCYVDDLLASGPSAELYDAMNALRTPS